MERRQIISKPNSQSAGFTLVETLLALAILAFIAGVVILNAPPQRESAQREAEIFAARLHIAQEFSVLTGMPMRLEIHGNKYRFLIYSDNEWHDASSDGVQGGAFSVLVGVDASTKSALTLNEQFSNLGPKIDPEITIVEIDAIGGSTPFTVKLGIGPKFVVSFSYAGVILLKREKL